MVTAVITRQYWIGVVDCEGHEDQGRGVEYDEVVAVVLYFLKNKRI